MYNITDKTNSNLADGQIRFEGIDLLRSIAILSVVMCHSTEALYELHNDIFMRSAALTSQIGAYTLFTIGRLGVPIFFLITGFLLLDKEYDNEKCMVFYKKSFMHLLICTWVWWLIYGAFRYVTYGDRLGIIDILEQFMFLKKTNMSHDWYMPVILGIYLLIPFIANGLKKFDLKTIYYPYFIFSFYAFIFPVIRTFCDITAHNHFSVLYNMSDCGVAYILYVVSGYMIKKTGKDGRNKIILLLIGLLSFVMIVWMQVWVLLKGQRYNVWYDNGFLMITSAAIFVLLYKTDISNRILLTITKFLSKYSFAVYLIHNIIRYYVARYLKYFPAGHFVKTFLGWAIILLLSYLSAWILSRIPKVGR